MKFLLNQELNNIFDNNAENIYNNYKCFGDVSRDINGNIYFDNKRDIKENIITKRETNKNKEYVNEINEYNPIMTEKENIIFNKLRKKHKNILRFKRLFNFRNR